MSEPEILPGSARYAALGLVRSEFSDRLTLSTIWNRAIKDVKAMGFAGAQLILQAAVSP